VINLVTLELHLKDNEYWVSVQIELRYGEDLGWIFSLDVLFSLQKMRWTVAVAESSSPGAFMQG
jgi:hypothetical protein